MKEPHSERQEGTLDSERPTPCDDTQATLVVELSHMQL